MSSGQRQRGPETSDRERQRQKDRDRERDGDSDIESGGRRIIELIGTARPIIDIIETIENGSRDHRNYGKRAPRDYRND